MPATSKAHTRESKIRQLNESDSVFVSMEIPGSPSHIGGLAIIDPATSADFSFERFIRTAEKRIALVPRFGWKLREVSFGLDRPYWEKDDAFDVRRHIHRIALPAPGDERTLAHVASRLHEHPLDRNRPLWEMIWIEGLEGGKVAVYTKVHHALIDGVSGIGLFEVLMDLSPAPEGPSIVPDAILEVDPVAPDQREIWARAVRNGVRRPIKLLDHLSKGLGRSLGSQQRALEAAPVVPRVPFNGRISSERASAFVSLPLEEVLDVKKHFEVSLNELLLAIVGSSLRRVLRANEALPERSLIASCPVSTRKAGDKSLGNQMGSMTVTVATDLADPIARLREIQRKSKIAKRGVEEGSVDVIDLLADVLPPASIGTLLGLAAENIEKTPLPSNFVFSNVRGIPVPVYIAGARVQGSYPLSIIKAGVGLNITACSSDGRIDFGITTDARQVADPWPIAEGIRFALEEFQSATTGIEHASREEESPSETSGAELLEYVA